MITARASRPRRSATLLVAVATGALALGGCQATNPMTTTIDYAPADGIQLDGPTLDVRDLLVISHGNGSPGVVSGMLVNSGTEPLTVTVSVAGQPLDAEVMVDPGTSVRLDGMQPDGSEVDPVTVPAVQTPAGQSVEVRLNAGQETLAGDAPVLLPHGPYADFADQAGGTVEPWQPSGGEGDH